MAYNSPYLRLFDADNHPLDTGSYDATTYDRLKSLIESSTNLQFPHVIRVRVERKQTLLELVNEVEHGDLNPLRTTALLEIIGRDGQVETAKYSPELQDKLYHELFRTGHGGPGGTILGINMRHWSKGLEGIIESYNELPTADDPLNIHKNAPTFPYVVHQGGNPDMLMVIEDCAEALQDVAEEAKWSKVTEAADDSTSEASESSSAPRAEEESTNQGHSAA